MTDRRATVRARCSPVETTAVPVTGTNARCQKNNWEAHRAHCQNATQQNATQIIQLSRMLGPAAEARYLSFVDWCKHSKKQFAPSALWALGAGTDADRTGAHLFVIYIDVEETISTVGKTRFKRRVRTAKCASEAEVTQECAPKYSSRWEVPPAMPFCARILLVDDGLPNVLGMFDQIGEEVDIVKIRSEVFPGMECDWLPLLEDSVAAGDQLPIHRYIHRPGSTPAVNELRYRHTDRWKLSHAEQFARAASSALDIPRHPQRIDVEEERQGVFGKHTVRSAKMISLVELRPLFHGDAHIMKATLFPQPNILRTVIVDDSLPFGRNIQVLGIDMSKAPNPRTLYPYYSDWLTRLKRIVEQ
ncbi:hypothetical protein B0H17DRAFT_1153132 [Mycena rosella]|uniref:MYND-type domain-containing protein n=1 Tax=Mycena rosella TaxID=1033263 RepID=A0AAD7B8Y6_MYCRO|nr:hypothetical protein B0H17DRAFT_1153132 [Mycena rosella]